MGNPIPPSPSPRTILLIKLRHHGDIILTTPVINALRLRYPEAQLDILLYQETRPILEAHPAINKIHVVDRKWKKEGILKKLRHEWALISAIRASHYDLVINLADQWRSALLTILSGAPVRIGFNFYKRNNVVWRCCHNRLVSTEHHLNLHVAEQHMTALAPLGIPPVPVTLSMHYTDLDWQYVQTLLAQQKVMSSWIVLQPTSRWFFKCWEDEKMAGLIDGITRAGHQVILTSAPDEKELAMISHILSLCQTQGVISLAGQLSLTQLAALIDHAQLFIGVDSAPMHMAAALRTPCLALFGPTSLHHWRPWGDNNKILWAGDYGALPDPNDIHTHTTQRYLSAIPVEDVLAAVQELLHD